MITKSSLIPSYLKAASAQGLRRLMFQNNAKTGLQYNYITIQFVNGYWYAWYYKDISDNFTGQVKEIFAEEKSDGK